MAEMAEVKILTRYLARELYGSIALVFFALLMLFSFLDLISELGSMGRGNYSLGYVLLYVVLTMPSHIYDMFPIAILIGAIFALSQLAANSELVVFRSSGVSLWQMVLALFKIGLPLVVLSYLCGELLAPPSERAAQSLRLQALNSEVTVKEFRSGVWMKDGNSFVNVKSVLPDTTLLNLSIYEFDENYHLSNITTAERGSYSGGNLWRLEQVSRTRFVGVGTEADRHEVLEWRSAMDPDLLNVLLVVPEQMSVWNLYNYVQHLRDNHQNTARYEIVMWNKLLYPFVVLVMLLLALPFAAHQRRAGGISGKIFAGIILGLAFSFLGRLFGSLGALNDWQPVLSALAMPMLFLMMAGSMLWWTERR